MPILGLFEGAPATRKEMKGEKSLDSSRNGPWVACAICACLFFFEVREGALWLGSMGMNVT